MIDNNSNSPQKPCDLTCSKCGSGDVYRTFFKQGRATNVSYKKNDTTPSSEFVDRSESYFQPAKKDCIVHHCRCCQFVFDSDVLDIIDK